MRRIISPRTHGVLDYLTVAVLALAPAALDLSTRATTTAFVLAGSYLVLSLLTDYPLALVRLVPFRIHGIIEALSVVALPLLPWWLDFSADLAGRNLCVALAVVTLVVAMLTDWDRRDATADLNRPGQSPTGTRPARN
ncbi:MAG: hypothetical protein MUE41_04190 [Gemmatimonadaceae bacterium]|jgi:hypothetical protein|nr:hypothetical protein [Gemmatimonadaceae bacterium]